MDASDFKISEISSYLLSAEKVGEDHIVTLPIVMADGSSATVRVVQNGNKYFVGDLGLSMKRSDDMGQKASFYRVADSIAKKYDLRRNGNEIGVNVSVDDLYLAISEVALSTHKIVERIAELANRKETGLLETKLVEKLSKVFGDSSVTESGDVVGSSQKSWTFSAIVSTQSIQSGFQVVTKKPQSVYRASAAFHDIHRSENPIKLVAVVEDSDELGNKLGLLSPVAHVVEQSSSEERFRSLLN